MERETAISEHDTALDAYLAVRTMLSNNELLTQGIQPLGPDGQPLLVTYQSDDAIRESVTAAYGDSPLVESALKNAYDNHYAEKLNRRNANG